MRRIRRSVAAAAALLAVASGCVVDREVTSPSPGTTEPPGEQPTVEIPAEEQVLANRLPAGHELIAATTGKSRGGNGRTALRRVAAVGRTEDDPRVIEYTLFKFEDEDEARAAVALPPTVEVFESTALDRDGTFGFVEASPLPTDDLRADLDLLRYGPAVDAIFQVLVEPTVLAIGASAVVLPAFLAPLLESLSTEPEVFQEALPDGMAVLVDEAPLEGMTFELRSTHGTTIVEMYPGVSRSWFDYFSWGIGSAPGASELVDPGTSIRVRSPQFFVGGGAVDPERTMVWDETLLIIVTHPATAPSDDLAELLAFFRNLGGDELLDLAESVNAEELSVDDNREAEQPSSEREPVSDVPNVDDMARLQEYVETARNIEAGQPIAFEFVDDFPTDEAVGAQFLSGDLWLVAVALGLTEDGQTLEGANQARIDRIKGTPGVVELQPTRTFTDVVVVHEMVHVIDPAPQTVTDLELLNLGQAVSEGNAHRIAFDYLMALPEDQQAAIPEFPAIFASGGDERISAAVQDLLEFSYDEGRVFMAEIAERGGEELIEAVLRRPPVSTEQLLFVDAWESIDTPVAVESPDVPVGADLLSDGTLGVYLLYLAAREAGVGQQALEVLDQWAGDRFVSYQDEGQTCLSVRILLDTDEAAAALANLLDTAGSVRSSAVAGLVDAAFCS